MGQEPEQIREDIEATRSRMGETVEALGYKADVKSRVAGSIQGAKDKVVQSIAGTKDSAVSGLQDKTPSGDDLRRGAKKATGLAQENPLGLAVGAIAVGFLAGLMVPATRTEDEKLGPVADQVKEKAKETGQEALDHGKQVVQETAQEAQDMAKIAADSAKDKAQGHADEVRRSVKEKAQDVSPS